MENENLKAVADNENRTYDIVDNQLVLTTPVVEKLSLNNLLKIKDQLKANIDEFNKTYQEKLSELEKSAKDIDFLIQKAKDLGVTEEEAKPE